MIASNDSGFDEVPDKEFQVGMMKEIKEYRNKLLNRFQKNTNSLLNKGINTGYESRIQ